MEQIQELIDEIKEIERLISETISKGEKFGISERDKSELEGIKTRLTNKLKKQIKLKV